MERMIQFIGEHWLWSLILAMCLTIAIEVMLEKITDSYRSPTEAALILILFGFGILGCAFDNQSKVCSQITITPMDTAQEASIYYGRDVTEEEGIIKFRDPEGEKKSINTASLKDAVYSIKEADDSMCE